MTLEELKTKKKELGYTNKMISERTGIPLGTVQKVFAGVTKAPRWDTIRAIEALLNDAWTPARQKAYYESLETGVLKKGNFIREEALKYGSDPKQGSYTIKDYYTLPEDRRVELIDGFFFDMASPSKAHQVILGGLHLQLAVCAEEHPGCELFFAPSDVRLDQDDRTVVQPDLYIVCGRDDPDRQITNGAPDFVAEIISPGNRHHDMFRKLNKYRYAGVREYWIIDPEREQILVYLFEDDRFPSIYSFSDTIPVFISEGHCSVDFARIRKKAEKYL